VTDADLRGHLLLTQAGQLTPASRLMLRCLALRCVKMDWPLDWPADTHTNDDNAAVRDTIRLDNEFIA
jgi:hypothetical protein